MRLDRIPQSIKSLQSVIFLYSLWRQDWLTDSDMAPGEWADKCLGLLTPEELEDLSSSVLYYQLPSGCPGLIYGVSSSLRSYALNYYNIHPSLFDYALKNFVEIQLCRQMKEKEKHAGQEE